MASQSLYRKWRSQSFDDIIGQDHVVRTLQNAVRHDRVAHAYLFTGPRGTGKTSTARILAKAVNCLNLKDGVPCAKCELCISVAEGRCPDVIEIDGASNTGIDDIRVLRERSAFAPAEGRFKVYIVDEVHRLSPQAFDGLLKTLEEPPSHVIFIFASTEPHKVPATILSRCQRFDFHKIDREHTIARLSDVAGSEGMTVEPEALALIAQQSSGSLRDALGILDQVRAFSGEVITSDEVRSSVGIGRPATIAALTSHIISGDAGAALQLINHETGFGVDPRTLGRQLIEYWRVLLLHVVGAGAETDVDPALKETAPGHAGHLTPASTIAALRALTEQVIEPRLNVPPELPLEIAVVQAMLALETSPIVPSDERRSAPRDLVSGGTKGKSTGDAKPVVRAKQPVELSPPEPESQASSTDEQADRPIAVQAVPDPSVSSHHAVRELPRVDEPSDGPRLDLAQMWPEVLEAVRTRSRSLQAWLRSARPEEMTDEDLTLTFRYAIHRDEIDRPENRAALEAVISEVTGEKVKVHCVLGSKAGSSGPVDDTDAFIEEAERMLRGVHARQFRSSKTES